MKANWFIQCPQCGKVTKHHHEIHSVIGNEEIWQCEPEDGGCGVSLVVRPMAELQARIRVVSEQEYTAKCTFDLGAKSELLKKGGAQ